VTIPFHPHDVTAEWLTAVLRSAGVLTRTRVQAVKTQPLHEAKGITGQLTRIQIVYDTAQPNAPRTLVVKCSSPDPEKRAFFHSMGFYEREVRFYEHVADHRRFRTPRCYFSAVEPAQGLSLLVLEDLGITGAGSWVAGCSPAEAELAIRAVAEVHAAWWQHPQLKTADWLRLRGMASVPQAQALFQQTWQPFLSKLSPDARGQVEHAGEWLNIHLGRLLRYIYHDPPCTLIHNDYNAENLFFAQSGGTLTVTILDWQLTTHGRGALDVASLLGGNLDPTDRRNHEIRLLRTYHSTLTSNGVQSYTLQQCWNDYRIAMFYPISRLSTVVGFGVVSAEPERELCDVLLPRYLFAIRDLQCYEAANDVLRLTT
jgi:hypothetical protein